MLDTDTHQFGQNWVTTRSLQHVACRTLSLHACLLDKRFSLRVQRSLKRLNAIKTINRSIPIVRRPSRFAAAELGHKWLVNCSIGQFDGEQRHVNCSDEGHSKHSRQTLIMYLKDTSVSSCENNSRVRALNNGPANRAAIVASVTSAG